MRRQPDIIWNLLAESLPGLPHRPGRARRIQMPTSRRRQILVDPRVRGAI